MRIRLGILPVAAFFGMQMASADLFTIDRDNSGGVLCSIADPCGTVAVTGTNILHVVITMDSGFGIFGNNNAFGFNVVGSTSGVAMSNFSNANFDGTGGSGTEDGWGTFGFRVDGPGGSDAVSSLSFDVTRAGTAFTGPADIEAGAIGGNGFTVFGLHVRNNSTGFTGFAGVDATAVPEPSSVLLLGGVVLGLGCLIRKRLHSA